MSNTTVNERIARFRAVMQEKGIDLYVVPTADFHESEYAGAYFKVRKFLSGFTGSAGTLIVSQKEAGLWTDGRYFIQAAAQLEGTCVTLFRMGEEGVPTTTEYIVENMPENGTLGFDGRVINSAFGNELKEKLADKHVSFHYTEDLADAVWTDRPALSCEPAWILDVAYSGKSTADKLAELREAMRTAGADVHVLTSLDDIAWLFNIRGNDIPSNPVVLSYAVVTADEAILFIQSGAVTPEVRTALSDCGVTLQEYNDIYEYVKTIPTDKKVLCNKKRVNFAIINNLPEGIEVIDAPNPTTEKKAVKNETELNNLRAAHIKDGVAVTKFMYWLKKNVGKLEITEISASDYLEQLRREQEGFLDLSFGTIAGYNANAAMMHYSATPESNAVLKPEGFLLVDSGGQYLEGTTDITRTFVLGPIPDEWKLHFTTVLRSMLNLASAKFLHGCRGVNLDILARGPLWDLGIDYKCGTGHGVGYLLNVHEGPNGFRWKIVPERNDSCVLEEGMVTTDEPGVYVEGSHGIRTENELICRKAEKNEYGQFMVFEHLTMAPIDLDGVDVSLMSKAEIKALNDYHALVYQKLSPYMTEEENAWLKEYTRAV